MDTYELADMLADEIEESGKSRWSAKDVKEFFLSEGINLSLDEILQVWNVCPSPVCACELLGCDAAIMADEDIVGEDEIIDVYLESAPGDTFYMEAQTQYDVITISAINENRGRYEATYQLKSEENGVLSEGTWRKVTSDFFQLYNVSHDYKRQITQFAMNY